MFSDLSSYKIISISHLPLSSHLFICRSTPLPSHISTHLYMYERIGTTWCKLCNQCRSIGSFYSRSSACSFSSPAVLALLEMAGSRIKSTPLLFGSPFSCGDIGDTDTDTQMGRAATLGLARSAWAPYLRQFGARAFLTGDMFYFFHVLLNKMSQKSGCSQEFRC